MRALGLLALLFWGAHAVDILTHHAAANLLWSCNVAALAVAAGLLARRATPVAAGGIMLILGEPLWLIDLSTGGEWMWTSPLTHFGVLALALVGMRRLGVPRAAWLWATAAIGAATALARAAGPPADNVNLAFSQPRGWEAWPHPLYLVCLGTTLGLAALVTQGLLRLLGFRRPLPEVIRCALR